MNKILLYVSLLKDKKMTKSLEIADRLSDLEYEVFVMSSDENFNIDFSRSLKEKVNFVKTREEIEKEEIDFAIVVGGDGSLIGFCRKFRDLDIPVVGLNIGTLGFLTELSMQNYERTFRELKDGKIGYTIQERTGLYIEYEGGENERLFAVNDVTIARGVRARIIETEIYINGIYFDTFTADGVIVSTATGSTAYNLSAGGPILFPSSTDVIITPICPHSLSSRSIVITKDDIVTLKMISEAREGEERAFMTIDGQDMYQLKTDTLINIKSRNKKIKFLVFNEEIFYRKIREKIK